MGRVVENLNFVMGLYFCPFQWDYNSEQGMDLHVHIKHKV